MKNNFKQSFRKSVLIGLVATSTFACKKEKTAVTPGAKAYPSEIQVGVFDPSKFEVVSWEPNDVLGWWDSIPSISDYDLTNDGVSDIRFIVNNQDIQGNLAEDGYSNAALSIETMNPDVYILSDSSYIIPFDAGDSIRMSDHWEQGSLTLLNRTYTCCPATPHVYEGLWSNNVDGYIGIRHKNRLGWIKVRVVYNCALKTYHFAFSK